MKPIQIIISAKNKTISLLMVISLSLVCWGQPQIDSVQCVELYDQTRSLFLSEKIPNNGISTFLYFTQKNQKIETTRIQFDAGNKTIKDLQSLKLLLGNKIHLND